MLLFFYMVSLMKLRAAAMTIGLLILLLPHIQVASQRMSLSPRRLATCPGYR
ncbi:hypothetical protein BDV12DRAFT_168110 [Aspergillus spectabilis]